MKKYRVWKRGKIIKSSRRGLFAGITTQGVFGKLTCGGGKRAKKENRVFFHTWNDAIEAGYRPCKLCKPEKPRGAKAAMPNKETNRPLEILKIVQNSKARKGSKNG